MLFACVDVSRPVPLIPPEDAARVDALTQALTSRTSSVAALELARVLTRYDRAFEAADILEDARRSGNEGPMLHAGLAEVYMELGYSRAVVRELTACLSRAPSQPDCLELFGRVLEADGSAASLRNARQIYTLFLKVAPNHPNANRARSALEQLGGPLELAEDEPLFPPIAAAPSVVSPHGRATGGAADPSASGTSGAGLNEFGRTLASAFAAMREGRPTEAELAYRSALQLRPNHLATLAGLAEAQAAQGKITDALETVTAARAIEPSDPQVQFIYGSILLRMEGRRDEALATWRAILRDSPDMANQLGIAERLAALERQGGDDTVSAPPQKR
ncbi:MAG: tetratricopeptide repeat protein [Myxococcales bacterium]|nr:tetratricopeptide repeat protein [Myxococcales bacterium]